MSIKIYQVQSELLGDAWIVKAHSVKGAIVEALAHLKPELEELEQRDGQDVDLDLEVTEIKETVTSLSPIASYLYERYIY